ncbi:MAG: hypothetical protein LC749_05955 [Actinobacteria bacterium]|nr:hypothetical protein [Actinomycetota bacterium]
MLTILTFVEAVVLVAVLALFLRLLAIRLRSVATKLDKVNVSVGGIEKDVGILSVGAPVINNRLQKVVDGLGQVAARAESLLRR